MFLIAKEHKCGTSSSSTTLTMMLGFFLLWLISLPNLPLVVPLGSFVASTLHNQQSMIWTILWTSNYTIAFGPCTQRSAWMFHHTQPRVLRHLPEVILQHTHRHTCSSKTPLWQLLPASYPSHSQPAAVPIIILYVCARCIIYSCHWPSSHPRFHSVPYTSIPFVFAAIWNNLQWA